MPWERNTTDDDLDDKFGLNDDKYEDCDPRRWHLSPEELTNIWFRRSVELASDHERIPVIENRVVKIRVIFCLEIVLTTIFVIREAMAFDEYTITIFTFSIMMIIFYTVYVYVKNVAWLYQNVDYIHHELKTAVEILDYVVRKIDAPEGLKWQLVNRIKTAIKILDDAEEIDDER
jgi:hypothetical protein